jgi:hypothetical protein
MDGHAKDWYINAEKMGLQKIRDVKDLREGDLLCFDGGFGFGHISIVKSVTDTIIYTAQQNITHNKNDLNYPLFIKNMNFDTYIFQGGLRLPINLNIQ